MFTLVESGNIVLLLPWLMAYTRRRDSRQQDAAHEASEEAELERASSACRHAGGVEVAACTLLAERRSAGNEGAWSTMVAKFPSKDPAAVSAAAAAAVLANVTEAEDGNAPRWRPGNEYTSEVPFDVISSRSALSDPGNDRQRFAHLQFTLHTDIGREEFGRAQQAPGGDSSTNRTRSRQSSGSASCSRASPHWKKVSTGWRRHDMEEAHHHRGYATVEAAVGGGQPTGEAVWGRRARTSSALRTESTNATRDRQVARCH